MSMPGSPFSLLLRRTGPWRETLIALFLYSKQAHFFWCEWSKCLAALCQKGFLDTLSVPACCTEHKASSTLLHLPFVDAKGQER